MDMLFLMYWESPTLREPSRLNTSFIVMLMITTTNNYYYYKY